MISAVMIVRNEAARIEACLAALAGVVDEVVVVDTGSTDRTVELAAAYTDRIFHLAWPDDFAAARNASIAHARGAWILVVDADEVVEGSAAAGARLRAFVASHPPETVGTVQRHNVNNGLGAFEETVDHIDRFFHAGHFHYEGRIHEQVAPIAGLKRAAATGVHLVHTGYAQAADDPAHKSLRNIPLLLAEIAAHPDDEYAYYQLAKAHYVLREFGLAAEAFEAALERMQFATGAALPLGRLGPVSRAVLTGTVVDLAYAYVNLGRAQDAAKLLEKHAALGHLGIHWADFAHVRGYVYLVLGDVKKSRTAYETSLSFGTTKEDVLGTGSFASYYHLGLLDEAEGKLVHAAETYATALTLKAAYRPAISRAIDWVLEGHAAEGFALLARAEAAAAAAAYIERIGHSLDNGDSQTAKRLLTELARADAPLRDAVADWAKSRATW